MTFSSVYEITDTLCMVRKQHYWCYFNGTDRDDRWTNRNVSGSGSFIMSDNINTGFRITTGASNGNRSRIDFNCIRHYDCNSSVSIQVTRSQDTARQQVAGGFVGEPCQFPLHAAYSIQDQLAGSKYLILAGDGCCTTNTATCVCTDGVWRSHKIELTACDIQLTLCGGCVDATHCCTLPTIPLEPIFDVRTVNCGAHWGEIRYSEAYNI